MVVTRPPPSGREDTYQVDTFTRYPPAAAAGVDRRAGSVADFGVGDGGGDRAGRSPGHDQAVGRGDRADQARDRGLSGGQLLVGMAAAHLAGEDFSVGLDRQRADVAGQVLAPVSGLSSTTAGGGSEVHRWVAAGGGDRDR